MSELQAAAIADGIVHDWKQTLPEYMDYRLNIRRTIALENRIAFALTAAYARGRAEALATLKKYVRHGRDCDIELVHRGVKYQRFIDTECTCGLAAALAASTDASAADTGAG